MEQARANRATAEATLLANRRAHLRNGQDGELDAWLSDTHGVTEVTKAMVVSQECEVYNIGGGSAQDGGGFGVLGGHTNKREDLAGFTGVEAEAYEGWRGCGRWCSGRAIGRGGFL